VKNQPSNLASFDWTARRHRSVSSYIPLGCAAGESHV
jgi:hypothetical protein